MVFCQTFQFCSQFKGCNYKVSGSLINFKNIHSLTLVNGFSAVCWEFVKHGLIPACVTHMQTRQTESHSERLRGHVTSHSQFEIMTNFTVRCDHSPYQIGDVLFLGLCSCLYAVCVECAILSLLIQIVVNYVLICQRLEVNTFDYMMFILQIRAPIQIRNPLLVFVQKACWDHIFINHNIMIDHLLHARPRSRQYLVN